MKANFSKTLCANLLDLSFRFAKRRLSRLTQSGVLCFLLFGGVVAAADNWPEFRGPNRNGVTNATSLPTKWSETENIRWKTPIHGKGWSSPVIWGEQIWMTTALPDGKEMYAVCVDKNLGKIIHDLKLVSTEKPDFCHAFNSYASPTPVLEAGRVYVHFGSYGTFCLDTATGKKLWERRDLPCNHFRGPGSSPILHENLLILTFDGFDHQYVAALNKSTGDTVWKTDRDIRYSTDDGDYKKAYSTPGVLKVEGQTQIISPAAEATIAFDAASGKEVWRVIHGGMNAASRPVFGHGLIYLTSGHTAHLYAVKQGLAGDLTKDGVVWKGPKGAPSRSSMLLLDDWLFTVNDGGIATCLDAKTGTRVWQERLGSTFSASPIYANGNIYLCDEEGKTHVIQKSGKYQVVAVNKLDAGCMASPAVVDNTLYLRTKTHLYCIAEK